MLLVASRRKMGGQASFKQKMSTKTHFLSVSGHVHNSSPDLVTDIGQAAWLSHLGTQGAQQNVLIYVHGYNTKQLTVLARQNRLRANLGGFPGAVIAFDWPTYGGSFASFGQYTADRKLADRVTPFFMTDVVAPIVAAYPSAKVHLLATPQ